MRYVIIDSTDLDKVNFKDHNVKVTESNTVMKNRDGSKAMIKYYDPQPKSIQDIASKSEEYTKEQFLEILASVEWAPDPLPGV